jgi:hypothetical protein
MLKIEKEMVKTLRNRKISLKYRFPLFCPLSIFLFPLFSGFLDEFSAFWTSWGGNPVPLSKKRAKLCGKTLRYDPKSAKFRYKRKWLQYLFWCEKHSSHPYLGESGLKWLGVPLRSRGVAWSGIFELVSEFFIQTLFGKMGRCGVYWM